MEQIIKNLWLGSDDDVAEAKRRGYSRLACCKYGDDSHRSMLGYTTLGAPKNSEYLFARRGNVMALNLLDLDDPAMIPDAVLQAGVKFITEQINAGNKILVHCNAGKSRSPSITMMYLRSIGELPHGLRKSIHVFKTLYPPFDPGHGMKYHLMEYWKG
jgi:hypothetical protein